MPYHHLAMATRDIGATHEFYERIMGFRLVKVEIGETPAGGWAKHFFYDTGQGELLAFWELHDKTLPADFPAGLSEAAGLPAWVNHVAFAVPDRAALEERKAHWLDHGCNVLEIDHNWCYSIYTADPNGTMVEYCVLTEQFTAGDRARALAALTQDDLPHSAPPAAIRHHNARTDGSPAASPSPADASTV